MLIAIDYGSKLAGTTVVATYEENIPVKFEVSQKKRDADEFLYSLLFDLPPSKVFIDAPLSLPGKYLFPDQFDDFFYRQADRELKAMSPMFLGGLTARAMKLKSRLELHQHELLEVYPGGLARVWNLKELNYKKEKKYIPDVVEALQKKYPFPIESKDFHSWHHVDAFLALHIAYRFSTNQHQTYGIAKEGQIFI